MWWARELFSSLRFLAIRGSEGFWKSKRIYEAVIPLAVTALFASIYWCFSDFFTPNMLSAISEKIFNFMIFAVPFHLAALGAFSTFEKDALDRKLSGTNSELRYWDNTDNQYFYKTLTLRQYTSLLFGYLCTIGIAYISIYIVLSVVDFDFFMDDAFVLARILAVSINIFFIMHYFFLTVYSITFLFDKINSLR